MLVCLFVFALVGPIGLIPTSLFALYKFIQNLIYQGILSSTTTITTQRILHFCG